MPERDGLESLRLDRNARALTESPLDRLDQVIQTVHPGEFLIVYFDPEDCFDTHDQLDSIEGRGQL
ncbi:hypothetical protein [Paludibaculum fermentans]|uniref:Uncharacterized protein n=1 Tax=Paludibaculum fermentans TaxID=1473598 RepID=A0A7S7NXC4_PALFE|nr:hypothetical protein [Paludibaculum fermentans]QOY91532.1 hypothetical protein IRI77_16765 [Paludibaculum fermentans]